MAFRKSLKVTPAKLAANRKNAQKSTGPRTEAGKRRAALNHYSTGFYATLESQRRQALEVLGDQPDKLARLQQDLMASWQPVNAMQALVVTDLAGLYWRKIRLENFVIADRLSEKRRDEGFAQKLESVWRPGSENWNLLVNLDASLDEEIAAKVKLMIQLKSFSAAALPPEGESIEDQETDQAEPAEDEQEPDQEEQAESGINQPGEPASAENVKIEGTNPPSTIQSTT